MPQSIIAAASAFQAIGLQAPSLAPATEHAIPGWAMLIPLLPMLGFVLCALTAAFKVRTKLPAWITVGCLAGTFAATLALYLTMFAGHPDAKGVAMGWEWITFAWGDGPGQSFTANFSFYFDSLTILWMLFVTGLATLIALYASEYMAGDVGKGYSRFFSAFCLFVFSMSCLVMADNLVLLYLGWEGVGLCSYLLIGYFYKKPTAVAAAKKAFIVNRIGDLFLALGIFLTFVHFGSVEYVSIFNSELLAQYSAALSDGRVSEIPLVAQLIPVLLMLGAFGKSAQLPLYVWLPDAMEGPTPVSALIHAATMVTAGVFLIARMYPLFLVSSYALPIVAWVGTLTALVAATIGMAQFDIKRIMAYSTVSQLGYMFAGLGVLTSTGAAFHVVTHAFFKALLFLCCGAVMHGFAGQLDLRKLSGVIKMPGWTIVGVGMLVGCLNLAGFPFTAGYFSKDMILAEAFVTPGKAAIGWLLLLTAGLTAYYTFRVFFRVFLGPKFYEPGDELHGHGDEDHGHASSHGHDHAHGTAATADAHGDAESSDKAHATAHGHGDFHPHPPGWAINTVLATLTVLSIAAAGLYFVGGHGGAVSNLVQSSSAAYSSPYAAHGAPADAGQTHTGHAATVPSYAPASYPALGTEQAHAGSFFGQDPHKVMYYVSAVVGLIGIGVAFVLHLAGRTTAATSKADALLPALGPVAKAAQNKWYVDEIYDYIIRRPILVMAHVFHLIDQYIVDGLVDLAGKLPSSIGKVVRPSQSGELQGYAVGMVGGVAVILIIVLIAAS